MRWLRKKRSYDIVKRGGEDTDPGGAARNCMERLTPEQSKEIAAGRCPFCGCTSWLQGPRGPGSENVGCANRACMVRWNMGDFSGLGLGVIGEVIRKPKSLDA